MSAPVSGTSLQEDQKKRALNLSSFDIVRQSVLRSIAAAAPGEHDPWDEAKDGLAWIDNEIGMFDDMYEIINPEHKRIDLYALNNIADAVVRLKTFSVEYHQLLNGFLRYGGSDCPSEGAFTARDSKNADTIQEFFSKFPPAQEIPTQMQDSEPHQIAQSPAESAQS
jgi:hypothetical protein